jgi:hypothetical protein
MLRNPAAVVLMLALIDRAEHSVDFAAFVLTDWTVIEALTRRQYDRHCVFVAPLGEKNVSQAAVS